jgi:hypothetical protein
MPAGKYNELLQDYVCSCVLRVGRELLSMLPDDLVIVTAVDDVLNSATGHIEELPILSVAVSRRMRIPRHPATQPTNIRPPIPRSSGRAVGAQRRRFALLV